MIKVFELFEYKKGSEQAHTIQVSWIQKLWKILAAMENVRSEVCILKTRNMKIEGDCWYYFYYSDSDSLSVDQEEQHRHGVQCSNVKHSTEDFSNQIQKKYTSITLIDPDTGKDLTNDILKPKEKSAYNKDVGELKRRDDVNSKFLTLVSCLNLESINILIC